MAKNELNLQQALNVVKTSHRGKVYTQQEILQLFGNVKQSTFNKPTKLKKGDVWHCPKLRHYYLVVRSKQGIIDSLMLTSRQRKKRPFVIAKGESRFFPTADITMSWTRTKEKEIVGNFRGVWENDEQVEAVVRKYNNLTIV